jgi:hypothetical protein
MLNAATNANAQRMQEKIDRLVNSLNSYFETSLRHEQELAERRRQLEIQRAELHLQEYTQSFEQPNLPTQNALPFDVDTLDAILTLGVSFTMSSLLEKLNRTMADQAVNGAVEQKIHPAQ